MTRFLRVLVVFSLVLVAAATASAASFTFKTIPVDGVIKGMPGETVGWGYDITNDSPDLWLVFEDIGTTGLFEHGSPDSFVFDMPIFAPGDHFIVPFDPILRQGLFAFTWDADAPLGFVNYGEFVLAGTWYTGDPFGDGLPYDADPHAEGVAPYSVTAVPEPATLGLLAVGLGTLVGKRRLRRR